MNNKFFFSKWILTLFTVLLILTSRYSFGQENSLCENKGYVIGFFNGVWNTNTLEGAVGGLEALHALIGDTYNNEPIQYEVFYNHTGSTVGSNDAQDVAETFIQRANEIDNSGQLGQRFEYLWDVISNGDRSYWNRLVSMVPASAVALDALYQEIMTKSVAGYALLLSNPPTQADRAEHGARLDELALQGQKMLLVAHSQGNLFVNNAYDYITPKVDAGSVKVVHIAPASPTLRGDHVLADIDLVINALRLQGIGSVPAPNLFILPSLRDASGHTLVGTYLDGRRSGRSTVEGLMTTALNTLITPTAEASIGFFTVTLTWDGTGDVDLHTFEPNGTHVLYSRPSGTSGYLDVDNVVSYGPEHYYATCNADQLQAGTYSIGINNYSSATGRVATVQVASSNTGVIATKTLGVGDERGSTGNNSPIPVYQVSVNRDAEGKYSVSVE